MKRFCSINVRDKLYYFDRYTLQVSDKPFPEEGEAKPAPALRPVQREPGVNNVTIETTHSCNLRCDYCFHGEKRKSVNLDLETAKKFLLETGKIAERKTTLGICFMGGEASLNIDCMAQIIEWCEANKYRVSYSTTTNGTRFLAPFRNGNVADYLISKNVRFHVSIDGPAKAHDKHRVYADGSGSLHDVIAGLEYIKSKRYTIPTVRASFCDDCLEVGGVTLLERLQYLNDLIDRKLTRSVALEYVVQTHQPASLMVESNYREQLYACADWFIAEAKAGRVRHWSALSKAVEPLLYHRPRLSSGCGAGRGYVTLGCDGKIHACHRQAGGCIAKVGEPMQPNRDDWLDCNLQSRNACHGCILEYACGGGCKAISIEVGMDIYTPAPMECLIRKLVFECALLVLNSFTQAELVRMFPSGTRKPEPQLFDLLLNFSRSTALHVRAGMPVVSEKEFRNRLRLCRSCADDTGVLRFDPNGWGGRGKCTVCGCCTAIKLHWAEQACPLPTPRWLAIPKAAETDGGSGP